MDEGEHLDQALDRLAPASGPDRDLAWFLGFGVLRRRGQVDAALRPVLSRPLGSLDGEVRAVLRLGTFEKLFARTQPHAVVHQAVEVSRSLGVGRASSMVNAVLRRVTAATHLKTAEGLDHPEWLVARWMERYGGDAARQWCRDNGEQPPLFVATTDPTSPPPMEGASPVTLRGNTVAGCWRIDGHRGPVVNLAGFREGAWWVCDAAAVAVADLVAPTPGMRVLDACAAPGGKTLRLASLGAEVTATDRSAVRLELLGASLERVKLSAEVVVHDWTSEEPMPGAPFDAVLVDAPCTGLGTVRRHPEIRWRRQPQDVKRVGAQQSKILLEAARVVAPGGCLVYAVCSPEPEEGPEIVQRFLAGGAPFELETEFCTAPPEIGEDAHYGGRLRRRP